MESLSPSAQPGPALRPAHALSGDLAAVLREGRVLAGEVLERLDGSTVVLGIGRHRVPANAPTELRVGDRLTLQVERQAGGEVALRLLTGVVDLRPEDAALQTRLADAFDRAGQAARACAHRVALAEIRRTDADTVGAALRCERATGDRELSDLLLASVREDRVRERAEREAGEAASAPRARGDLVIEASWAGEDDVDLSLIAPDGSRLSWMGGRTTVVGEDARASGREAIGLRYAGAGSYLVEVSRTDPEDHRIIRGQLRIRVLGESRSVPFVLDDEHASISRVVVRRESRLVLVR